MYLADSHTHSLISPDSKAPLAEMAAAAAAAGLDRLCVTDHFDLVDGRGRPEESFDWDAARRQLQAVRASAPGVEVGLGLELGSAPLEPEVARRILAQGGDEVDFVLGSLHNWLGLWDNWDFYYTDYTGKPELCRQLMEHNLDNTWALVTRCPDCYDSLAHVIYPLRYMERDGQKLDMADYEERWRAIFTEVARTEHALEVNTNRGKDLAPWVTILGWFKECGGRYVTIGSDAHRPEDVGKGIQQGGELLAQAGFSHVTVYRGRKPELYRL